MGSHGCHSSFGESKVNYTQMYKFPIYLEDHLSNPWRMATLCLNSLYVCVESPLIVLFSGASMARQWHEDAHVHGATGLADYEFPQAPLQGYAPQDLRQPSGRA